MANEKINIAELYGKLEKEGIENPRSGKGEKAEKVRGIVKDIGKQTGNSKILQSAAFNTVKSVMAPDNKLDRSYFTQTVERTWETERDEAGRVWILLNKAKVKAPAQKPS